MQYCAQAGCSVLVPRGYCVHHHQHRSPLHGTRTWYYTQRWRRLRLRVLLEQAYQCKACGLVSRDLEIDHITRHDGNPTLFWDRANLQALCDTCHTRKTRAGQ